ncbi:bifunctional epoxide hydrolase 2 [Carassius gibelio]|uniref:bifunctional epoxide hydrolase 2 n=1 Tax=Carassius gibelio TaxID=101364 RepID=UPI0022795418|nr:bifunctional epoxide hydrolase 2 [Carassius gibelio]
MKKAVLFSLWGVAVTPSLAQILQKFEETTGISRGFIKNVIANLGSENALYRLEKGKISLTQMIPELEAECQKVAADQGLSLPAQFSAQKLFSDIGQVEFNKPVLDAAAVLHHHGISTGVLANIWVDDTDQRDGVARILSVLESHFNLVVRSCYDGARIPEPDIFTSALEKLALKPQEAVWLDVDEESIKAAEGLGMTAVQVKDITEALKEIQKLTGIEVTGDLQPPSCDPDNVSHGYVNIKPGVRIHFVEFGDGPPVLLCHGFPESWFSWRYQIPALANAGFRVLALDMKGYGDSTAPPEIEEYSQEQIMLDLVTFLDKMGIPQVTLVGHDWGGSLVWSMAQFHPERVRAVASLNTPLFPVDPNTNPMEKLKALPIFDYQMYFQKPGVAEAELEKNLERTFKLMFNASNDPKSFPSTAGVCQRGGLFVGSPEDPPRSAILSESALKYYVQQFTKSGFRGPLNWYRNGQRNWLWMCSRPRGKIMMPALMVTAGKDPVLLPAFAAGMENLVPNLTRGHIEECGHWTQMERPAELNQILISWLKETHQKASIPVHPKL